MARILLSNQNVKMIGKHIGNYIIERTLAQGGMGAVFVARDLVLGRQVAIKFVGHEPGYTEDIERRFLDEARITANLQHPNVVTIFDYGKFEGRLYYVMELLAGCDLASLMGSTRRFDTKHVGLLLDQICSGLHAAHEIGVVHRDLKPSNIFVLDGDPLRLKLMDFGVAKVASIRDDNTCHGQIIGTPRYMSPEQAMGQGERISPRSDIYSLGVIVYELLTGTYVFESSSPLSLLLMHVQAPVPKIRDCVPEVPPCIADLIESCLAKDPNERPESALAVAAGFAEALGLASPDVTNPTHMLARPAVDSSCDRTVPHVEVLIQTEPAARILRLDKTDRVTLKRLWLEMQKREDFPDFVRNGRGVGNRSGVRSTYSASALGESILKDAALTAKLLRIINSAYASRFGGNVDNVQHAIVILGIDRVQLIALSISLFENRGSNAHTERVSESAVNSLMSGEIAQQFAPYAQVSDAEQAMICGMLRNFGRHLVIVYLPELYNRILALTQSEGVSLDLATERVLGLSSRKLGLGVAERWRLPKPILRIMANIPGMSGRWAHEEDRMIALAEFSNELCEIVASESTQVRPLAIANLLLHHQVLLTLDSDTTAELLQSAQESFERRYSSLLGSDSAKTCVSRNLVALAPEPRFRTQDDQSTTVVSEVTTSLKAARTAT